MSSPCAFLTCTLWNHSRVAFDESSVSIGFGASESRIMLLRAVELPENVFIAVFVKTFEVNLFSFEVCRLRLISLFMNSLFEKLFPLADIM